MINKKEAAPKQNAKGIVTAQEVGKEIAEKTEKTEQTEKNKKLSVCSVFPSIP